MRFLSKSKKAKKTVLVISDLHLGAGIYLDGKRNHLEDFHSDNELVDFLQYYSSGDNTSAEIELIINGDFLDFLAVPYVKFFDDEFWSENAACEKLEKIYEAHTEVFMALNEFLKTKKKTLTYIVGNHDAELILEKVRDKFISYFNPEITEKITLTKELELYQPVPGVYIKHGHQYEVAHHFDPHQSIIKDKQDRSYFKPSWGSFYVVNIINKYKQERSYVNQIRPIKNFLIHGLIFDTFFTIRFMLETAYYFLMIRFRDFFINRGKFKTFITSALEQLHLFQDYEELSKNFFSSHDNAKVLIVGHTHHPTFRAFSDGKIFINTGTWTKMTSLDFANFNSGVKLTYAKIQAFELNNNHEDFKTNVMVDLLEWKGNTQLPYQEFN